MDFNNISFEMPKNRSAAIKVIGVGGGGSNAVNYMFEQGITGVDFIVSNTDAQALEKSSVPVKIQLGASITEGLGAGANPEVGEQAALETLDDLKNILDSNTKMIFITAGMGGGTGTGAAPIIAKCAKEMGILTVGICTAPFAFEGKKRLDQAREGIEKLRNSVDSLIIINNDKLRELYGNLGYKTGFAKADEVLATAAKGIAEVITHEYSINIDLRDARTVLADSGTAIMGSAQASGENKAKKAIELALDSPLLNDNKITGAKNVLLLIVSGEDEITMDEIGIINDYIQQEAGNNANIIMGMGEDESLGDNISVTVVATGFPQDQYTYETQEEKIIVHSLLDDSEEDLPSKQEIKEEPATDEVKPSETQTPSFDASFEDKENIPFKVYSKTDEEKEQEHTFDFKLNEKENSFTTSQPKEAPVKEKKTNTQEGPYNIFELDDEWEEEETPSINQTKQVKANESPKASIQEKLFTETAPTPKAEKKVIQEIQEKDKEAFDSPINAQLDQQIKERSERLKKFNHKFLNSLKNTEEAEKVPAYKRQGVNLTETSREKPSRYIVDEDSNNEIKIRPNTFLHDNVD